MTKRTILAGLLGVAGLLAQDAGPSLFVYGPWAICQSQPAPASSELCAGYVPGIFTYMLFIPNTTDERVVAYRYTVRALSTTDGSTLIQTGYISRAAQGPTTPIVTFSAPIQPTKDITVDELISKDGIVVTPFASR